jgi:hypothetical protein
MAGLAGRKPISFLEVYKERNFFSLAVSGDLFLNLFLINALDINK